MSYLLSFGNINSNEISNPTVKDLEKAVVFLTNDSDNYLTYESIPTLNRVQCIQATAYDGGYVHAEVLVEGSVNSDVIRAYGQRMTIEDLLAILNNFKDGILPDIKDWEMAWSN